MLDRMFNPNPVIRSLPVAGGHHCYVIDDALLEPERLVDHAVARRAEFEMAPHNAYPGLELRMPDDFSARLDDFFRRHLRQRLGARRTLSMYSRLSLVTLAPEQLQPAQWICHRDRLVAAPGQTIAASVLYLFRDPALGGTRFYLPKRPEAETMRLIHDSVRLPADEFARRYGLQRGYPAANDWFEPVLTVPAQWNRLIFYDGALLHSGDIRAPERLGDDPRTGRLTLNGFFTCSRGLAAA